MNNYTLSIPVKRFGLRGKTRAIRSFDGYIMYAPEWRTHRWKRPYTADTWTPIEGR
jgi:hypothetical protein